MVKDSTRPRRGAEIEVKGLSGSGPTHDNVAVTLLAIDPCRDVSRSVELRQCMGTAMPMHLFQDFFAIKADNYGALARYNVDMVFMMNPI